MARKHEGAMPRSSESPSPGIPHANYTDTWTHGTHEPSCTHVCTYRDSDTCADVHPICMCTQKHKSTCLQHTPYTCENRCSDTHVHVSPNPCIHRCAYTFAHTASYTHVYLGTWPSVQTSICTCVHMLAYAHYIKHLHRHAHSHTHVLTHGGLLLSESEILNLLILTLCKRREQNAFSLNHLIKMLS